MKVVSAEWLKSLIDRNAFECLDTGGLVPPEQNEPPDDNPNPEPGPNPNPNPDPD